MSKYTEAAAKKPNPVNPAVSSTDKELDVILATDDGKQYLEMCQVTGVVTRDQLYGDPIKTSKFTSDYYRWKDAGKPSIQMPTMPEPVEIVIPKKFSRRLHRGREHMTIRNNNGTEEGVKHEKIYHTDTHPITGAKIQLEAYDKTKHIYTLEFDPVDVKKRMERAANLMDAGEKFHCYIIVGDMTYALTPKNFMRSREDLVKAIAKKEPLNI